MASLGVTVFCFPGLNMHGTDTVLVCSATNICKLDLYLVDLGEMFEEGKSEAEEGQALEESRTSFLILCTEENLMERAGCQRA